MLKRKHMKRFKKEALRYPRKFGLQRYKIYFNWHNGESHFLACCNVDQAGGIATLFLAKDWSGIKATKKELRLVAFHEIMELFLSNMDRLCNSRFLQPEEIEEERHRIIRTLEKMYV